MFAPEADALGVGMGVKDIVNFIGSGRNVLVAAGTTTGEMVRTLSNECGVDFDENGTRVVDHFSFDSLADAGLLHSSVVVTVQPDPLGLFPSSPVLFSGIGQTFRKENAQVIKAVHGNPTSYSTDGSSLSKLPTSGVDVVLVTAIQARNNARVTFSGSLAMFGDMFFGAYPGNKVLVSNLAAWNFQTKNTLKAGNVTHFNVEETSELNPKTYRIKDVLDYSIELFELNAADLQWKPFLASDVQLEVVMLDAYIRTTLTHDGNGKYHARFMLPDVPGIYALNVLYNRVGYSLLDVKNEIKVRPFAHNEYERFLDSAYPYYTAVTVTLVAFFIFSFLFLFEKRTPVHSKNE